MLLFLSTSLFQNSPFRYQSMSRVDHVYIWRHLRTGIKLWNEGISKCLYLTGESPKLEVHLWDILLMVRHPKSLQLSPPSHLHTLAGLAVVKAVPLPGLFFFPPTLGNAQYKVSVYSSSHSQSGRIQILILSFKFSLISCRETVNNRSAQTQSFVC